ncbi:MAG TPA: hypothetical protein VD969_16635 [Symbiobacteriaceae bacterium]|nr:hypothetical protein [Symbiobacteriaceae bacterium]
MSALGEYRGAALRLVWWATLAELLLVRIVSRVGIFIPKSGMALTIYRTAIAVGEVAFSFSLFMGVALLVLALAGHRWWAWAPGAAAGALVMIAPGPVPPAGWSMAVALVLCGTIGVMGAGALRAAADPWERAAMGVVLGVHALGYLVSAVQLGWEAFGLPDGAPLVGPALVAGELLAVVAPVLLAVPLLRRGGPGRGGLGAIGLGSAAALGAALLVNADITAILAMYSLGFTLSWSAFVYMIALGLGVPGLVAFVRRDRLRGLSLGLLFLAGYSLGVNQQHLLVLAGWALLSLPAARIAPSPAEEVSPA